MSSSPSPSSPPTGPVTLTTTTTTTTSTTPPASASTRFFNIPELSTTLVPCLTIPALSALTRTSRHLQTLFEPWLFHELTFSYSDPNGNLLMSARSVQALARNTGTVRWLMCDQEEIGYLFNCLLLYQEQQQQQQQEQEQEQEVQKGKDTAGYGDNDAEVAAAGVGLLSLSSSSGASRSGPRPRWVPLLDTPSAIPTCTIIPLPPLSRLCYLELNLMPLGSLHWPQYRQPSGSFASSTLRQTCWIIQQCPLLAGLELVHVPVRNVQEMRLLAGTVCGMRRLRKLHLFVRAEERLWRGRKEGLWGVLTGLGGSIEVCKLFASEPMHEQFYQDLGQQEDELAVDGNNNNTNADVSGEDNQYQDIPELPHRMEPLYNLKKLVAWGMEHLTVSEILSVFDHCPNIDRLKVPSVSFALSSPELTTLARSISDRCPHLRTLAVLDDLDGPLLVSLMEIVPTNQLEAVKINTFEYSGIDLATTRRMFTNHAASLRLVDLRYTTGMSSKDMMVIFEVCSGLEEFKKHPSPYSGDVFMTLQDAIAVPWASKKIRHLELTIGIPDLVGMDVLYDTRCGPGPVVVSEVREQEQERFDKLDKFYRQIAGLVELEYLDLRAVNYDSKYDKVDEQGQGLVLDNQSTDEETHINAFPGLLSLPSSNSTHCPGYLELLSGWTKLKTFRGSIRLDVGPNATMVGEKEVEWFVEHWPALERVAFFRDEKKRKKGKDVPAGFLRLREARPRLVLWH